MEGDAPDVEETVEPDQATYTGELEQPSALRGLGDQAGIFVFPGLAFGEVTERVAEPVGPVIVVRREHPDSEGP